MVEKENIVDVQLGGATWKAAPVGAALAIGDKLRTGEFSRAAVRFTDLSMLRLDELTTIEISPPLATGKKRTLDVRHGGVYFFSREKAEEMQVRTAAMNGALRGTEFAVRVAANGRTTLTMFEGEVEMSNAQGRVLLKSGEQGEAEPGKPPHKTAVIAAVNIIQWCLYYPGVLDPAELGLDAKEQGALAKSLDAYRAGDLLGALAALPVKQGGGSADARLYRAAVILSVGQVDKARAALAGVPVSHPGRQAIEQMIAAVKFQEWRREGEPRTAGEWMAESYYQQSRSHLEAALKAARKATELSPSFGFAWARVAELEFSFGRTSKAMKTNERALELAPRNAQAHALQGFLLSAENRIGASRRSFDEAIALDGALGNAWLGRGLTLIRQNHEEEGRGDLQTAAALEPNRSILRSYLGKAFSQVGINAKANLEFDRAKQLDPNDPTPWLYSAIQRKQENRYNEAVDDLEKSVDLNDNRRVYRSGFLLDQDRSIRGTNLAAIYLNDGMVDQSVREAVRAVDSDYGSAPAHLFLAESYDALRDPERILLRYESAWSDELLMSNLLSPVGGGPLSQFVTNQEYSKMFEKDGFGISTDTQYLSSGELRETASQYGAIGNISYSLDTQYLYNGGIRPNNRFSDVDTYGTFKFQLTPKDTLFFQTEFQDLGTGNVFQYYDPRQASSVTAEVPDAFGVLHKKSIPNTASLTYHYDETQDPALLLLGWHHEWSPGNHTLLLLGRLADKQDLTSDDTAQTLLIRDVTNLVPPDWATAVGSTIPRNSAFFKSASYLLGRGNIWDISGGAFDLSYKSSFEIYTAELQQIVTLGTDKVIFGGRYQQGQFDTHVLLTNYNSGTVPDYDLPAYQNPAAQQDYTVDFQRVNLYLYDTWHVMPWLSLTGGLTYDAMHYPGNFRIPPVNGIQDFIHKVSPKAGIILQPWRGATIRSAYAEAISGVSFDDDVRLEPSEVAGFLQSYRSLASESLIGSVAGSKYQIRGLSVEQKLPTRTYLGVEYDILKQSLDRTTGDFDYLIDEGEPLAILPSSLAEKDRYQEDVFSVTLNQLVSDNWALGAQYRYTHSSFRTDTPALDSAIPQTTQLPAAFINSLANSAKTRQEAGLHEVSLYALYNHPSGFFARAEANCYQQENDNYVTSATLGPQDALGVSRTILTTQNVRLPGANFWQFNLLAGYRFHRNQCELSCGVLNITGRNYELNPLNPYLELPRDRTLVLRCKLTF